MRHFRWYILVLGVLLLAAGAANGQTLLSIGFSTINCATLAAGQTCGLTARVDGLTNRNLTWSQNPVLLPGLANTTTSPAPATGNHSNSYTAPFPFNRRESVVVTVTAADGAKASQVITLVPPTVTVQVTPSATQTLLAGQTVTFIASVLGVSQTSVKWSVSSTVGSYVSNGNTLTYTAPSPITATTTITFTATSEFDQTVSASGRVQLNAPSISISPTATVPLAGGQRQQFTATVNNLPSNAVTWSINPQVGSIDQTGLYTAPAQIAINQTVTVTATSVVDTRVFGTRNVQLSVPSVTISPTTVSLGNSQQQQFTATVNNLANSAVTWSINPAIGSIDQTGLYTAPGFLAANQRITVIATSVAEPARTASASVNLIPAATVGGGAPTDAMVSVFQAAWNRKGFNELVVLPPVAPVRVFGNSGYVQEFTDVENTGLRHALVTGAASVGGLNSAFQILAPLWAYYSTVNPNTAGYPTIDSEACSAQGIACVWGLFDKGYALFAYKETLPNGLGPNFTVNGAFYTAWTALGGISTLGSPVSAQSTNVTATVIVPPATLPTTATVQSFAKGAIYQITRGPNLNRTFGVFGAIYDLYIAQSGPSGSLGMPTSEAYQFSPGVFRQNFEGGALQYNGTDPSVLLPVTSVALSGAPTTGSVTLNVGQTLTLVAMPTVSSGEPDPARPVTWSSTNGKVVSIQPNGGTAVVTAIGAGAASVQAASGGISSAKVNLIVISQCCQVGDGAPASVQQAFGDALLRNKIAVQTPLPSPAERAGGGYVQLVPSADGKATFLLALSDRLGAAYVVSGALLAHYEALGGPSGTLGFPAGDASDGGTQLFANGALGGNPVRLVRGAILGKWALLGYESGAAGLPMAEASGFSTFGANSGQQQRFSKGIIVAATSGPRAGQAYFTSGVILSRYEALGGTGGDFGMPTSDEFVTGSVHQQNFEGGNLTYSNGDSVAVEHSAPRVPGVVASPASVSAGGRARIAVLGFPNGSALRISVAGSPDFTVNAASGAFTWEMAIPLTAKSGVVAIRAMDGRGVSADGSITVRGFADNRIRITKIQGDNQAGLPGSVLPLALRVLLADASGAPVAGAAVTFTGSPGVELSAPSALSDGLGQAEVFVRLPGSARTSAVNVSAPSIAQSPVTFNVLATADTLRNVPKLTQAGDMPLGNGTDSIAQKGALLTSVASILQYHQNRGELRAPNGPAEPAQLNDFLKQYCTVDARGVPVCDGFLSAGPGAEQVVNLWRAAEFTGGVDVVARGATVAAAIDALAAGSPALLSLSLSRNGVAAGGHFVVATGVAEDGSLVIQDPNPTLARTNLRAYLGGFVAEGVSWTGELRAVVQFAPRNPPATRFVIGAISQPPELMRTLALEVQSVSGNCGMPMDLLDAVDRAGNPSGGFVTRLRPCDGADAVYQLSIGTGQPYRMFVTDLATAGGTTDLSGAAPAIYKVTRDRLALVVTAQQAGFAANAVVNAATFEPGIAPGGIVSIFGTGLAGPGTATSVEIDGVPAPVLSASPFQVNAVLPAGVEPGRRALQVRSAYGAAVQSVEVSEVAPAIFLIGNPPAGAVVNQDGSLNGPTAPLSRGGTLVIYSTGLGAVTPRGELSAAVVPVTVILNGVELATAYAGLTPGYAGLYQVNVAIPLNFPPGLGLPLTLKQGVKMSNAVPAAVQ